jgi:glucokinase
MTFYVGVDLGGTNIKAGIVDVEAGKVVLARSAPTLAHEGPEAVMARMADLVAEAIAAQGLEKAAVGGVGLTAPGRLDLDTGTTVFLPNLLGNWPNVPLRDTMAAKTGLPVFLLNDVRAITFGEWKYGAGRGVDTIACFAVGTGIGGGLVINGRLHLELGGTVGELGHLTIDFNGPECGCGNHGCLEVFASGPAIAAMGIKAVIQGRTTRLGEMVGYDLNKINPQVIYEAAVQGDAVCLDIYDQAGMYLGVGAANVLAAVGARKLVIGGGVAAAGDLLLEPLRRTLRERVRLMPVEQVEVVQASLGSEAGVLGVAVWAAQNLQGTVGAG